MADMTVSSMITERGMAKPHQKMSIEKAEELWHGLWALHDATPWVLGDFYLWLNTTYGEEASQAFDADTVEGRRRMHQAQTYASVCRQFPHSRRLEFVRLTFSHFAAIASVKDSDRQTELLAKANAEDISVMALRSLASSSKPAKKKKPKTVTVKAESVIETDPEQPVFDRASAARDITPPKQKEEAPPAATAKPASVSVRFTRIIVDILALEHNPVLAADLLKEKFDRIDDLNQAIFRLMQTRDALLRGGEKVSRWPHKSEIEGSTPSPATNPSAAAEVQEEAPPTPPVDLDEEPSTPHRHGQDISTGGEMPDLPASLKREKEATHGR